MLTRPARLRMGMREAVGQPNVLIFCTVFALLVAIAYLPASLLRVER